MKIIPLLLLFIPALVSAQSSVWKVSKGDQHIFIGGTIHVLSKKDYPLPATYNKAYQRSARLVFETDIEKVSAPGFQQALLSQFSFTNGKDLRSSIRPTTFTQLKKYCAASGIPLAALLPFKPQFVALMLTSIELQKLGANLAGVDDHFNKRALTDNKPTDELETIEEQLQFLASMGLGQEDALILSTIKENRQLAKILRQMLTAWRNGDNAALNRNTLLPMQIEFPAIYQDLLVKRNNNWMPRIENYLSTPEVEFVLVGTLHLIGKDGLITRLKQKGYHVTQW